MTPEEAAKVAHIAADCIAGPDVEFSNSGFCKGFLNGLSRGDLTDYGFGFVPASRKHYIKCPAWVSKGAAYIGYGDFARSALIAGGGDIEGALNKASVTVGINDIEDQIGKNLVKNGLQAGSKYVFVVGATATAIDALCTNF